MRKLAPVFLISVFALASANALAMGDRQKSKAPSNATTPSTAPATTPSTVPSTDTSKDKIASNNSAAKTNPAGTSPNCMNGKDATTGKDCQALGGDSGSGSSSGPGSGAAGSSSSSSGASGSSGGSAGSSK